MQSTGPRRRAAPPGAWTVLLTEEREAKLADAGRVVELKVGKGEIVTVELEVAGRPSPAAMLNFRTAFDRDRQDAQYLGQPAS